MGSNNSRFTIINFDFIGEVGFLKWFWRTAFRQYRKKILRRGHTMYLPTGEQFFLPISSHFASEAFVTNGNVDWGSEALLFRLLKKEGSLLDVGANIGYYSLYLLPKVTSVYSFEPDPRNIKYLRRNIDQKANIFFIQKAVGEFVGKTSFTLEESGEVSHITHHAELDKNTIEVEITTIDSFVKENSVRSEAIKIDAEGFDIHVLRGAIFTLRTQRSIVLTEAKPSIELFEIVRKLGYLVFAFTRDKSSTKCFLEINFDTFKGTRTKMLFLVPEEMKSTIIDEVSYC